MKLENQVVNLKYAKKLKQLRFKQESLWYWVKYPKSGETKLHNEFSIREETGLLLESFEKVSAYTVAELGEMLPIEYQVVKNNDNDDKESYVGCGVDFKVGGSEFNQIIGGDMSSKTEANARAKMLIYLKENKLL